MKEEIKDAGVGEVTEQNDNSRVVKLRDFFTWLISA